jgi:hypothetical protein
MKYVLLQHANGCLAIWTTYAGFHTSNRIWFHSYATKVHVKDQKPPPRFHSSNPTILPSFINHQLDHCLPIAPHTKIRKRDLMYNFIVESDDLDTIREEATLAAL